MSIPSITKPSRVFTCTNSGVDGLNSARAGTALPSMTRTSEPSARCSRTWVGVVTLLQMPTYCVKSGLKIARWVPPPCESRVIAVPSSRIR